MTAATRRKVNPSAKARANAAAARRRNFNLPLRSRFRLPISDSQEKADPEQTDEISTALALRQRIKVVRQANIERELKLKL
jgi:hypothetical protein